MKGETMIWSKAFWLALVERIIATAAQGGLLAVGADIVENGGLDALTVDWVRVAGFALGGAFLALAKGLAVGAATGDGPGVGGAETLRDARPDVNAPADATAYIDADEALTAYVVAHTTSHGDAN